MMLILNTMFAITVKQAFTRQHTSGGSREVNLVGPIGTQSALKRFVNYS